jgi:superfamily I DNA/RNA helicase
MIDTSQYSAEQLAAIQSSSDRVLILSGAGSGKSRVIIGRIKHLVENGVRPQQILAITFTVAAGKVLTDRLGFKIGYSGNLHAFLLRLLNQHGSIIGFSSGVGVVDDDMRKDILAQIVSDHKYRGTKETLAGALKENPKTFRACPSKAQLVAAAYWRRLRESNALDFDGILTEGKRLIDEIAKNHPDKWPFRVLCVDEYQDAADSHAAIYTSMPVEQRFFCGDKNQGIYRFLGGSVNNIIAEASSGATVLKMERNYRCCKSVCRAASKLIEAGGGTEQTLPIDSAPEGVVEVVGCNDPESEIRFIAEKIRELHCENSCCVLFRTNPLADQAREALSTFKIPVVRRRESNLPHDWPMVRCLLAALAAPENDLLCESLIAAVKGKEQAAVSRREAIQIQIGLNDHCLHLPSGLDAAGAVAFVLSRKPSQEAEQKLATAAALLEPDSQISDLMIVLAEPPKQEATGGGVIVTTIHGVKGQEYSVVFIGHFNENIIPLGRADTDAEEERRLAYVGFTRAEQGLYISYVRQRQEHFGRHATVQMQQSRFIREAGLI